MKKIGPNYRWNVESFQNQRRMKFKMNTNECSSIAEVGDIGLEQNQKRYFAEHWFEVPDQQ